MMSVMSGPSVTSTATRMKMSLSPPAASNRGLGYQTVSMKTSTAAAIATLSRRWIPEALQRDILDGALLLLE
jgi:hypothetical protein